MTDVAHAKLKGIVAATRWLVYAFEYAGLDLNMKVEVTRETLVLLRALAVHQVGGPSIDPATPYSPLKVSGVTYHCRDQ